MNKYNIEVGDKLGRNDLVTKVDDHGIDFDDNPTKTYFDWEYVNARIEEGLKGLNEDWILTKMNKGKIIGYTLLKDSISAKAGDIYNIEGTAIRRRKGDKSYVITQEEANQLEWFSPIYEVVKPTEVYVDTLAGKVKVTATSIGFKDNEIISHLHFNNVAKAIKKVSNTEATGWNLHVETFSLGCKKFASKDIIAIEEAIKQVS